MNRFIGCTDALMIVGGKILRRHEAPLLLLATTTRVGFRQNHCVF